MSLDKHTEFNGSQFTARYHRIRWSGNFQRFFRHLFQVGHPAEQPGECDAFDFRNLFYRRWKKKKNMLRNAFPVSILLLIVTCCERVSNRPARVEESIAEFEASKLFSNNARSDFPICAELFALQ